MFVTELEAREMTCPTSMSNDAMPRRCKAADCMAWRWGGMTKTVEQGPTYEFHYSRSQEQKVGFCGLGGFPAVNNVL